MKAARLKLVQGSDKSGDVACLAAYLHLDRDQRLSLLADWIYVLEELQAIEADGVEAASKRPGNKQAVGALKDWLPSHALKVEAIRRTPGGYTRSVPKASSAACIDVKRYACLTKTSQIECVLTDYPDASYTDIGLAIGVSREAVAGVAYRAGLNKAARQSRTFGGPSDD